MKRIILILLTGIFLYLITSCKGERSSDVSIDFNSEITPFDTKALVTNVADLQSAGLSIFGLRYPSGGGSNLVVFQNTKLYYDPSSPTLWNYAGTKPYWIPGQTYKFIALFPYYATDYTYTPAGSKVTTSYTSALTADQTDLMYSVYQRSFVIGGDGSAVPLNMKHCTSSLTFKIRNVSANPISVSNISLKGLYYEGTCTIQNSTPLCAWTTSGNKEGGTTRYPGKTSGLASLPVNASTYYELFSHRILVIPQQVQTNTDIKINLHISPNPGTAYDLILNLSNAVVTEWIPSKHYVYTITITENRILFDVEVLDWIEDEVTLK